MIERCLSSCRHTERTRDMKNLLFVAMAAAIACGASAAGYLDLNGEWELKAFPQPDPSPAAWHKRTGMKYRR